MGGFAGGDEAGYWDVDTFQGSLKSQTPNSSGEPILIERHGTSYCIKAFAKDLITSHHPVYERWIRSDELYDTICFVPSSYGTFTIEGDDDTSVNSHPIYQAYRALCHATNDPDIEDFFSTHKVVMMKRIPDEEGFGRSASNVAAYLRLTKEVCNLILSTAELAKIARTVAPAAPFFVYNYRVADVSKDEAYAQIIPVEEK